MTPSSHIKVRVHWAAIAASCYAVPPEEWIDTGQFRNLGTQQCTQGSGSGAMTAPGARSGSGSHRLCGSSS